MVLTVAIGGAASCSSDSKSDATTTTAKSSSDSGSSSSSGASNTGNAKVDDYCNQVDEVAAALKKVKDDPSSADAQAASQKAQELATKAQSLVSEVVSDPSLASAITDCTKKLSTAGG